MKNRFFDVLLIMPNGNEAGLGLTEYPTLEDMQGWVKGNFPDGLIERITTLDGKDMLVNEEGLLKDMEYNPLASKLAGQPIVGTVAILENFHLK